MTPPPTPPRCWTVRGGPDPRDDVEVEVRAGDGVQLGQVRAALAGAGLPDGPLWAGSDRLADTVGLDDPRLRHGARLGSGRPGHRQDPDDGALELHVCAGPDAGRTLPLGLGPLVVGRGAPGPAAVPCRRLELADPAVSRGHLEVTVTGSGVTVRDLGSENGSHWQRAGSAGETVGPDPAPWPLGARVRLGTTSLRLTVPAGVVEPLEAAPGGRLLLAPRGRPAVPDVEAVPVAVPPEPEQPPRRAPAWVALLVPAVAGGALALALSSPHFLLFALLGPVVALGTWGSDSWSGRRGHRRRSTEHAAALAGVDRAVSGALVREVDLRDRAAPDLAVLATAARRRTAPLWAAPTDRLTVRLGTGDGPTAVVRGDVPVTAPLLPVALDLGAGGLRLAGPRAPVLGLARSVLCQLAVLHPPDALAVTVLTSPEHLPDWAWTRWLPHCRADPATSPPSGTRHGPLTGARHLVVLDAYPTPEVRAWLRRAHATGAVVVVTTPGRGPVELQVELHVAGETGGQARLLRPGRPPQPLDVDLAGAELAERVATDLAPLAAPRGSGGLPDQVRWRDLVADRPPGWSRSRDRLAAVLGTGAEGPVELDLCTAGPHAVVAGTTGAGKSELLRTLVLGLARSHPPDRCSFLLVDYKGGAAFAEATDLPHTVGVLTDLDGAATARALQSLGAELTRRERVLAAHGARDLVDLPDHVLLPRLVIVVDEFATLGEELPGFVPGLVGIAQRGRSLGVHLVLATQRPAGSVGPEIRANCSVRLCLRTVDETGSREVLGLPDAAHLPVDRPGRALLRIGGGAPVLLQVARVGTPALDPAPVTVRRWQWPPAPGPVSGAATGDGVGVGTDLADEVARLRTRAAAVGGPASPPRPWLPPLPDRLGPLPLGDRPPGVLVWGLVDRPDQQAQEPLLVDLAAGGGWLVLGGPGSGRTTALHTLLAAAVGRLAPDRLHVHVVDHAGGELADRAAGLPHTGTCVPRGDGHRLRRLLARLQAEVDRRRLAPGEHPHVLLLVDGLDAVADAAEEVLPGGGSAALLRLVREGAAVGLTAVLTADRVLPGSRLAGVAGRRLVLPLPDRADYPLAGVPVARVPGHRPAGRGLLGPDAVEVQLALPGAPPPPGRRRVPGRIEVVELPADPPCPAPPPLPRPRSGGAPPSPGRVVLGPGGDDGAPVVVDLPRCGGLLVAGPPGSGRSTTLQALGRRLEHAGADVLRVVPSTPPDVVPGWGAGLPPGVGVVLADDLGRLPDPLLDALAALCAPGAPGVLVAAAAPADVAAAFRGPAPALRRNRTALLLQPARGDAELLGLRLPRDPSPARPGAGWLVTAGDVVRVQVAR